MVSVRDFPRAGISAHAQDCLRRPACSAKSNSQGQAICQTSETNNNFKWSPQRQLGRHLKSPLTIPDLHLRSLPFFKHFYVLQSLHMSQTFGPTWHTKERTGNCSRGQFWLLVAPQHKLLSAFRAFCSTRKLGTVAGRHTDKHAEVLNV